MKALLLGLVIAAALAALPGSARADTGNIEVVCSLHCWITALNGGHEPGWIDPEDLPEGIGGNVPGGDGAVCELADCLDKVGPDDLIPNPCYLAICGGDDGDGGVVICDVYCIHYPSWYGQFAIAATPNIVVVWNVAYDYQGSLPLNDDGGVDTGQQGCEDYWSGVNTDPWPGGCRALA